MTDEELIARLRDFATREASAMPPGWPDAHGLYSDAADRIEALVKERDEHRRNWNQAFNTNAALLERAERLEAAIRELKHRWYLGDLQEKDFAAALKGADHE